jgi:hypothetical protein
MTRAVTIAELGDTNVFTADGTNNRVGIGSTQPTAKLDVDGDGNVSGTLTATAFVGDGTGLTGVASTDNIITGTAATFTNNVNISGITTVGVLTATQVNVTGVLTATQVNATGLTGTPDITIQNVTGVAGTFTGFVAFSTSISVGGTITYEDVTNVDSIGIVTARSGIQIPNDTGKLRSGTDLEMQVFHDGTNSVIKDTRNSGKVRVQADNFDVIDKDASITMLSATSTGVSLLGDIDIADKIVHTGDTNTSIRFPAADTFTVETAGSERFRIHSTGISHFKAGLAEKVNVKSQLTSANACAITDGNVILTTSAEPGNTYPDITGVHSVLSSGEGFSVTIALKVDGSGTINGFRIDGVAQTIEWSGGSGPSAGSNGYDVFSFSVFKTGSGTTDYTVFGAAANYT